MINFFILPYCKDALEPFISKETIDYHHGKHHNLYVNTLNTLIKGTDFESHNLESIIHNSSGKIFNNASQVWNHNFYWQCLSSDGKSIITSNVLSSAINDAFGTFENFKNKFFVSAMSNFGSGWTWLVKDTAGKLLVINTSNADSPVKDGFTPILVCDVWEHAYYIDYRNLRLEYLKCFFDIINWNFAAKNYCD